MNNDNMGHFCTRGLLIKCCWVVLHCPLPILFSLSSYLRCFSLNSGNRRRGNAWTLHMPWLGWPAFPMEAWLWQKTPDRRQSQLAREIGEWQLHGGRHNQAWKSWESSWRRGEIKVWVGNWYCYILASMFYWVSAVYYCTVTILFPHLHWFQEWSFYWIYFICCVLYGFW